MEKVKAYLRIKEAADFLGVAPNTVRAWGRVGKIPEYRHPFNNYRLFKRSDLESVLKRIETSVARRTRKPR